MCGFVGYFAYSRSSDRGAEGIQQAVKTLRHRGPDAEGVFVGRGIALGHTRLSFLDITPESNQPFWDRAGRYCLVYNGEIYNFKSLREDLIRKGYEFRTQSDTEVLLYGLIADGDRFLKAANGMFAFALYDQQQHVLWLGRDQYGIKPLYWRETAEGITFGSEIRAFGPWMPALPDERRIASYLIGVDLPTDRSTFVQGVRFFPVGTLGRYGQGVKDERTFDSVCEAFSDERRAELETTSDADLIDEFDGLLNESVRLHMISDVPVGALCSGGVDSSVILALAAKHSSSLAIFHANVVGPHSEFGAARQLAKHLNLDLLSVEVRDDDFIEYFSKVISDLEFPFVYHPNSVPFFRVMGLVSEHRTKAVLTGEGADEILLGYSHIPTFNVLDRLYRVMNAMRHAFHTIPWLGRRLWRDPGDPTAAIAREMLSGFDSPNATWLTASSGGGNPAERFTQQLVTYHLRTLLLRNDRLGMAHSIEARFPFLEKAVFEFAVNLPYRAKVRSSVRAAGEIRHPFLCTKWLLRKVAERYLPPSLAFRAKRGFPTNALERMHIDTAFLKDSWIREHYQFSLKEASVVGLSVDRSYLLRLVMLEAWARTTLLGHDEGDTSVWLRRTVAFGTV